MTPRQAAGQPHVFAITCDASARVVEVLRDEIGLAEELAPGASFLELVDAHSAEKATLFLDAIRANGAVTGWELTVAHDSALRALVFAGAMTSEAEGPRMLIVGGCSHDDVGQMLQQLGRVNNEQTNAFRLALKEQQETFDRQVRQQQQTWERLTELNNELSNAQRELNRKTFELQRLNEEKNRFVGMAAHDLRNPLSVIIVYEQLIAQDEKQISDESRELLEEIETSSRFMLRIIDDLLDVSKIESGKVHLQMAPTDLVAAVDRNLARNRPLAQRKRIRLELEVEDDVPQVVTDATKFDQVLTNLVVNAIKYSEPDSCVAVSVSLEERFVHVAVRDEGQGIPEQELKTIFTPFTTLNRSGTAGEQSTGLGLTIVHRLVELLRGKIWVESELGRGSTFHVALPVE